jgi:hypothetical protein
LTDDLRTVLKDVPFIYDADQRVGRLVASDRSGQSRIVLELLSREDDDSYVATVRTDGENEFKLLLNDEHFVYRDNVVELHLPMIELAMDPVYVRKVKAFMRGNVPTPDIAGRTILGPPGPAEEL